MCFYCQLFDLDVNSCPYYDALDESYARIYIVIKTMNEHKCFVGEARELDLLGASDPSLPFLKLETSLYDNYESSHPLGPNFVNDTPLTALKKVSNRRLTSLPFVAVSSTPIDITI